MTGFMPDQNEKRPPGFPERDTGTQELSWKSCGLESGSSLGASRTRDARGKGVWTRFTEDMAHYVGEDRRPWFPAFVAAVLRQAHSHPGLVAVAVYRFGQWVVYGVRIPVVRQLLLAVYYVLFNLVRICLNTELPYSATIGGGLRLLHFGCLVHSDLVAGRGLSINHGVVIGSAKSGVPRLGDNVRLTVGAKVIGGVVLGNGVVVGAGAVVTKSFPDNVILGGVPARVIGELNDSAADD